MSHKNEIDKVVILLDEAFNQKDIDAVLSFYTKDAVVMATPELSITGHDKLRGFFLDLFKANGHARQIKTHILTTDDTALFTSKWIYECDNGQGERVSREGIATTVFKYTADNGWKIIIDNSLGPLVLER